MSFEADRKSLGLTEPVVPFISFSDPPVKLSVCCTHGPKTQQGMFQVFAVNYTIGIFLLAINGGSTSHHMTNMHSLIKRDRILSFSLRNRYTMLISQLVQYIIYTWLPHLAYQINDSHLFLKLAAVVVYYGPMCVELFPQNICHNKICVTQTLSQNICGGIYWLCNQSERLKNRFNVHEILA